jgi:hypothetical protein
LVHGIFHERKLAAFAGDAAEPGLDRSAWTLMFFACDKADAVKFTLLKAF